MKRMPIAGMLAGACRARLNGRSRPRFRATARGGAIPGASAQATRHTPTWVATTALRSALLQTATVSWAAARCSAMSGSGLRVPSTHIRDLCATLTANIPNRGSAPTRCCAAEASLRPRAWFRTPGAISTLQTAATSSQACARAPWIEAHPFARQSAGESPGEARQLLAGASRDGHHAPGRGALGAGLPGKRRQGGDDLRSRNRHDQAGDPRAPRGRAGRYAPRARGPAGRPDFPAGQRGRRRRGGAHAGTGAAAAYARELRAAGEHPRPGQPGIDLEKRGCRRNRSGFSLARLGVRLVAEGPPRRHGRALLPLHIRSRGSGRGRARISGPHRGDGAARTAVALRPGLERAGRVDIRQRGRRALRKRPTLGHPPRAHPDARIGGIAQRGGGRRDLPVRATEAEGEILSTVLAQRTIFQYARRSSLNSCRMVVAISSIDLVVEFAQRMPSRCMSFSACCTSWRQFSMSAYLLFGRRSLRISRSRSGAIDRP